MLSIPFGELNLQDSLQNLLNQTKGVAHCIVIETTQMFI